MSRASTSHPAHGDLDAAEALNEEQAAAMGRAGRKLERSIVRYRAAAVSGDLDETERRLDEVARLLYALVVQRECAGARSDNLPAIVRAYDVPAEALRRV